MQNKLFIFIIICILILSIIANINLWIKNSHLSEYSSNIRSLTKNDYPSYLAIGYAKMLSGDLNGLVEFLDKADEKNWKDINYLFMISFVLKDAELRARNILDLNPLLEPKTSDLINKSQLPILVEDLRNTSITFANVAGTELKGLVVDKKQIEKLDDFAVKVKRAKFPDQANFSWEEFVWAIDRYYKK
ncbi:hypothetical protein cpu_19370 [Carboxydothermus pertinax]|uniref:Uncharacterized protein n=1 Tax=Carboxydothermus pertinax TaxID=870242 RepID=A0A1L8CWZ8_9THEO|nr:hypothetical protein cpu_19370 [Carboxydothermus pertinax]